jgi:hypothetical protein
MEHIILEAVNTNMGQTQASFKKDRPTLVFSRPGVVIKDTYNPVPNGNCQFSAILDQLAKLGIIISENELRKHVVDYIKLNLHNYEQYVEGPLEQYVYTMSQDGTYGDHISLHAIAQLYGVRINVVSAEGSNYDVSINSGASDRPTIYLGHYAEWNGEHYISLRVGPPTYIINNQCTRASINTFLRKTTIFVL